MSCRRATAETLDLTRRRAFTLSAQCVRIADVVSALRRRFPQSPTQVRYAPDSELEAQFARQPPLETEMADALGFQHDLSLDMLVERAMFG